MRISELLCFGATPGTGNPALVVEGGPVDAVARQALARTRNLTVVYIDRPAAADGTGLDDRYILDYWYPHTRSPLCLHATLAAAHVLFAHQRPPAAPPSPSSPARRQPWRGPNFASQPPTLTVTTAVAGQPLVLSREGDDFYVQLTAQPVPALASLPALDALLARPGFTPASPPQVASVGSPKLLVEVPDAATLHVLQPDLAAITAWGKVTGVNGIYAWCRHPDGCFEGRNFNHLDPVLEDSATGVAAGALTALLGHGLTLLQGRATGRDCLIRSRIDGSAILVGGAASPPPRHPREGGAPWTG